MTLRSGLRAQLGVGEESTWGTKVAPTRFLPFLSESMAASKSRSDSESIYSSRLVMDTEQWDADVIEAGGSIQLEHFDRGMGLLWKHMMGTVNTTGAGPYTHVFTPGTLDAKSLTVQVGKPGRGGTSHPWDFTGSKITSWELAAQQGEALTLGLDLSSETVELDGTLASWSPPASLGRLMWHHCTVVSIHGSSPKVRSIKFSGDNGLETDRYFLGSQTIAEQDEVELRKYEGEAELEFADETLWDAFWAGTEAAIQLTATRGTYSLDVTANARLDGSAPVVEGRGKLTQSVPFTIIGDGSDADGLTVTLVNGDSAP